MKKIIRNSLFTITGIVFFFQFTVSNAQEGDITAVQLNNVVPPSPTAAELGKYGDQPVSYFTGTPQISIPIFEVKGKSLSLPISLSYHASGIQVSEVASWVGLGWSLNAGGVITRTLHGRADEKSGYFVDGHVLDDLDDPTTLDYDTQWDIADGQKDLQPDVFYYNFNGRSGKFVIGFGEDNALTAYTFDYVPLDISFEQDLSQWIITTKDGTKYYFGISYDGTRTATETSIPNHECDLESNPHIEVYSSAWYLMDIVTADETDHITLSYHEPKAITSDYTSSETRYHFINGDYPKMEQCWMPPNRCTSSVSHITYKISKISSAFHIIEFNKTDGRLDLMNSNGSKLSSIVIKDNLSNGFKRFDLSYGYFGRIGSVVSGNDYLKARLKLERLVESSFDNTLKKPPYIFKYHQITEPRDSKSQDHWGYFNDQPNITLVPEMAYGIYYLEGANREANPETVMAGSLKEIVYPTGGSVSYEFECHEADFEELGVYYEDEYITKSVNNRDNTSTQKTESFELTINHQQWIDLEMHFSNEIPEEPVSGSVEIDGLAHRYDDPTTTRQLLEPGTYTVTILADPTELIFLKIGYKVAVTEPIPTYVGGIRIKKITVYDGIDHTNDIIKSYSYLTDDNKSSGILAVNSRPLYGYNFVKSVQHDDPYIYYNDEAGTCNYWARTSTAQIPLMSSNGGHIFYSQVTETIDENGEKGSTIYRYEHETDDAVKAFPFPPPISHEWKRGKLKSITVKDAEGNDVKYTEYDYDYHDAEGDIHYKSIPGVVGGYRKKNCCNLDDHWFVLEPYNYKTVWTAKTLETTYNYEDDPDHPVITTTSYAYNGNNHVYPTHVTTTTSDGVDLISKTKYPQDFNLSADNIITTMVEDYGIIGLPVEQQTWKGDKLVAARVTEFGTFGSEDNIIKPSRIHILETSNPLSQSDFGENIDFYGPFTYENQNRSPLFSERAWFNYDENGNLIENGKTNDITISYLWGYNNRLPAAKIEGAGYDDASAQLTQDILSLDGDDLCNELNNVRTGLPQALVSSYTHNPVFGITSETAPNGVTSYYNYDALGRLQSVQDQDLNLIQEVDYNYIPYLELGLNKLEYQRTGGSQMVNVWTNTTDWEVSISYTDGSGWLSHNINDNGANGNFTLTCEEKPIDGTGVRKAQVTVTMDDLSNTFTVIQDNHYLIVTPNDGQSFGYEGGTFNITIETNGAYRVMGEKFSWLQPTNNEFFSNPDGLDIVQEITIEVITNYLEDSRSDNLLIYSEGEQVLIPVSQAGYQPLEPVFQGYITDKTSGEPIENVEVKVSPGESGGIGTGLTDDSGFYRIYTQTGSEAEIMTVLHDDYTNFTCITGDGQTLFTNINYGDVFNLDFEGTRDYKMSFTPSDFDFGVATSGLDSHVKTYTLTNGGAFDVSCSVSLENENGGYNFFIDEGDGDVDMPSGSAPHEITVRFAPQDVGELSATLTISCTGGSMVYELTGTGEELATPPKIRGYVKDAVSQVAIPGVSVTVQPGEIEASETIETDANGYYELYTKSGPSVIVICNPALNSNPNYIRYEYNGENQAEFNDGLEENSITDVDFTGVRDYNVTLSAISYNYGGVDIGESSSQTFTLHNGGIFPISGNIQLEDLSGTHFHIDDGSGSFSLAEGGEKNITVRFAPYSLGTHTATLNVDYTGGNSHSVSLTGAGIQVAETYTITGTVRDYEGNPIQNVTVNLSMTSTDQDVTDANGNFTLEFANGTELQIEASKDGYDFGDPVILTNVASNQSGINFTAGTPSLSFNTSSLSFPDVVIGSQSSAQTIYLTNTGGSPATGSYALNSSTHFYIVESDRTFNLGAGESKAIQVVFKPTGVAEDKSATLSTNADNGVTNRSVAVSGEGIALRFNLSKSGDNGACGTKTVTATITEGSGSFTYYWSLWRGTNQLGSKSGSSNSYTFNLSSTGVYTIKCEINRYYVGNEEKQVLYEVICGDTQ